MKVALPEAPTGTSSEPMYVCPSLNSPGGTLRISLKVVSSRTPLAKNSIRNVSPATLANAPWISVPPPAAVTELRIG